LFLLEFTVRNFKNIIDATLSDLGVSGILAAQSNSGRSIVLDAIQLFRNELNITVSTKHTLG